MTTVFVYGTLRKGENYHSLLETATWLDQGKTCASYVMHDCNHWYPIVAINKFSTQIVGELYEVDADTLKNLDRLEGYPHHYNRKPFWVERTDGKIVQALMYYQEVVEDHPEIKSGDWIKHLLRAAEDGGEDWYPEDEEDEEEENAHFNAYDDGQELADLIYNL